MSGFLEVLDGKSPLFSESQKKLAVYIEDNLDKAAFLRTNELARATGVSTATVVRFAQFLGYDGYMKMQKDIQDSIAKQVSENVGPLSSADSTTKLLNAVRQKDRENIDLTFDRLSKDRFEVAVSYVHNADRVIITGLKYADVLAPFIEQQLKEIGKNSVFLTLDSDDASNILASVSDRDAILCIAYSANAALLLDLLSSKRQRGARVIVISDNILVGASHVVDVILPVYGELSPGQISIVSTLSLLNAFMVALRNNSCRSGQGRTAPNMWTLQEILPYDQ